jgi:uncharacterized protein YndB with AHSA1/START domain
MLRSSTGDPVNRSLVLERTVPHAPEKVWRALTERALIADWLMPNDFEPVVGRRFAFRSEPAGGWSGIVESEVLEIEAPRRLVYRWASDGGLDTVVAWTLEAEPGGTRIRIEQSGFRPEDERNLQGATYGWTRNLDALARVAGSLG